MTRPTLTLNGIEVPFESGQTILEAASGAGVYIPTLCHYKDTTPTGACRICVVEVQGGRVLVPACATPATPGSVVLTDSPRVAEARRMVLELMLASGNHNCLICEANGMCELQALAYRYQVATPAFAPPPGKTYYYETNNTMIVRDFSKCIMCGRCVKACTDRQVNLAIGIGYRGHESAIVTMEDNPYIDSECVFCGECVQACPTGALVDKNVLHQGRPWEFEQTRTTCTFCGVGCQIDLHTKEGHIVKVTGADEIPNRGRLCVKGRFGWHFVHHEDRLKTPLIKENGQFREATWDEALDLTARRLREIKEKHGPQTIGGWCSARITNEENYLMQKFLRGVIGTNHVDHCARL
jgi:predicted molibdopterin-dependent oxidoreductase YjgC